MVVKALALLITTQIRALQMARFRFCPRMVWAVSFICHRMSTMVNEWGGIEVMANIKAILRIFHLCQGQRSANLPYLRPSWPNLKDLILNWHCTLRTKWQWQKLTIKRISFRKLAVWPRKRCKTTIIRLCSTIWKIITRYPRAISQQWVRFKLMKKKCARLSTRWWNRRFQKLFHLHSPE